MTDLSTVQLRLASGAGLLARADRALLYLPPPDKDHQTDSAQELIEGFRRTPEFAMLAEIVLRHNLDVHPFVWVSWDGELVLRSFGSAVLETDITSVPLLSGAASGTWVEHRVLPWPDQATIRSGNDPLSLSQLDSGVVPCGGFSLSLQGTSVVQGMSSRSAHSPGAQNSETVDPISVSSAVVDHAVNLTADPSQYGGSTETAENPERRKNTQNSSSLDNADDPGTADNTDSTERQNSAEKPNRAESSDCVDDQAAEVEGLRRLDGLSVSGPSVLGPSAPELLGSEETIVPKANPDISFASLLIDAGPRWSLIFDDGSREAIEQNISIGRSPEPSPGRRAIMIEGDRVSRHHFDLIPHDDRCEIVDAGSRNGTVIVSAAGGGPVALTPREPLSLLSGSAIYFGSRSAIIEWGNPLDAVDLMLGLEP